MIKWIALIASVCLSACAQTPHPLAIVKASDPYWTLNSDKWQANENDMVQAPAAAPIYGRQVP
jgi:hypothetical protein